MLKVSLVAFVILSIFGGRITWAHHTAGHGGVSTRSTIPFPISPGPRGPLWIFSFPWTIWIKIWRVEMHLCLRHLCSKTGAFKLFV